MNGYLCVLGRRWREHEIEDVRLRSDSGLIKKFFVKSKQMDGVFTLPPACIRAVFSSAVNLLDCLISIIYELRCFPEGCFFWRKLTFLISRSQMSACIFSGTLMGGKLPLLCKPAEGAQHTTLETGCERGRGTDMQQRVTGWTRTLGCCSSAAARRANF